MTGRGEIDPASQPEGPASDLVVSLVNALRGCVVLLDGEHRVIAASAPFCRNFDIEASTALGEILFSLGDGAWDLPALRRVLDLTAHQATAPGAVALDLPRPRGETARLVGHAERVAASSEPSGLRVLLTLNDVTAPPTPGLPPPDSQLSQSLLLSEARHRISYGLQLVATVLLQTARSTHADEGRGHLQAAYGRVMAVAALERQLSNLSEEAVGLQGYLHDLCEHMTAASIGDPSRISLRTFVDPVEVSASTAASLGMIVAELVINALKHAFPDPRRGHVTITFDAQGAGWVLRVSDNGVGMPEGVPEGGLGTEIVSALARQLKARVEVTAGFPGKVTSIRFGGVGGLVLQP